MIDYNDLTEEQKRKLRNALNVERINIYYLEDHNIILLNKEEMLEYVFLDEIDRKNDAIEFIKNILQVKIKNDDIGKTIGEIKLERHENIIKLDSDIYAYRS